MSQSDTENTSKMKEGYDESQGKQELQESAPTAALSSTEMAGLKVEEEQLEQLAVQATSITSAPAPPYTHRRTQTAPPWQEGQQWGADLVSRASGPTARGATKSPMGHQRSSTVPTITITQPTEPPAERIEFPPRDLLAIRPKAPAPPPLPAGLPQEAAGSSRASSLAMLRSFSKSAEKRKRARKGEAEKEHLEGQ